MSKTATTAILFPPGRLVAGSLTKAQTTDAEGKPLVVKSGTNLGQPRVDFYFGVAIPKAGETHWNQTEWGKTIHAVGVAGFPAGQHALPSFAWKITDGDSTVPNRKGKVPRDRQGYPGCWVIALSSGFAPKTFNATGSAPVDPESIRPGHWIQVRGSVGSNGSDNQAGVFLNHDLVAHSGFGPEINLGVDAASVGFGQGPAPAGMSTTPVAGLAEAAAAVWPPQGWTAHPSAPGFYYQGTEVLAEAALRARNVTTPVAPPAQSPPPPVPVPVPVAPNPAILAPPLPPPPPPAAAQHVMLTGQSYEAMKAAGWTDEQMIANGHMAA